MLGHTSPLLFREMTAYTLSGFLFNVFNTMNILRVRRKFAHLAMSAPLHIPQRPAHAQHSPANARGVFFRLFTGAPARVKLAPAAWRQP